MSTPNDIIDMFADLHKSIYREVGTLMGRVLEGRIVAAPTAPVVDTNLESRIMKAMDERFAALEKALTSSRLSGQKRKQPETPSDSEDSDDEQEAPTPHQNDAVVNEIIQGLASAKITDTTPAAVKKQEVEQQSDAADEAAEEEEEAAEEEEEAAEAEEALGGSMPTAPAHAGATTEEEEEAAEEAEEEEEEESELTPFKYKGKDYYMDGDCNVYTVDEEGELIEDPVGIYDEKTRRITFNS